MMTLDEYLKSQNKSQAAFAREIGVSPVTVHRYLQGTRFPTPSKLRRIETVTNGMVLASSFLPAEEAA